MPQPLLTKLRRLFDGKRDEAPGAPAGPARPASPHGPLQGSDAPTAASNDDFEAGLARAVAEKAAAVSGKVHVINVERIRARLGARWADASERIHRVIETTLQGRLSRKDFYTRHGELDYIILFGELSEDEAALKCSLLAEEILSKVLGSGEATAADGLDTRAAAVCLDGSVEFQGVRRLDAVAKLLEAAARPPAAAPLSGADEGAAGMGGEVGALIDTVSDLIQSAVVEIEALRGAGRDGQRSPDRLEALVRLLRDAERGLAHLLEERPDGGAGAAPMLRTPWRGGAREVAAAIQEVLRDAEGVLGGERGDGRPAAASGLLAGADEDEAGDVTFVYQPMWKPRKKTVGIYLCELAVDYAGGRAVGAAALPPDPDPALLGLADRLVLRKALLDVRRGVETEAISVVCVPVHYRTLADAAACRDYLALCRSASPDCRALLVFEIVEIPPGIWENPLFAAVCQIRPFARALFMRVAPDYRNFGIPAALGIQSIGVDLRAQVGVPAGPVRALERLADAAHRCGLEAHAHGVETQRLALVAVRSGFDYLGGGAISGLTDAPRGILRFDIEGLSAPKDRLAS